MTEAEIWRDIPRFLGYRASDQGRIGSCWRYAGAGRWVASDEIARTLKPSHSSTGGYAYVNLYKDGKAHSMKIARLVMLAFHGPCPEGLEICHNNGIRDDDWLCNLRYDTHSANVLESTSPQAQKQKRELSLKQAETARIEYAQGNITQAALGRRYGISQSAASNLLRNITYQDAGGPTFV